MNKLNKNNRQWGGLMRDNNELKCLFFGNL